ncbi:MAG: hypothetical protein ACREN7_00785 [Candidatus Dormibacteria bacterium]
MTTSEAIRRIRRKRGARYREWLDGPTPHPVIQVPDGDERPGGYEPSVPEQGQAMTPGWR